MFSRIICSKVRFGRLVGYWEIFLFYFVFFVCFFCFLVVSGSCSVSRVRKGGAAPEAELYHPFGRYRKCGGEIRGAAHRCAGAFTYQ